MTTRRLAAEQPASFAFTPENQAWCEKQIAKYPPGRQASAILSLLWRAQAQHDYWLPKPAIELVAKMLDMPDIRALEIATFYSMFNLEPVGKHFIQLCGTTPCMLAGMGEIRDVCEARIGPQRQVGADGQFSWLEVECLGACCNAPMAQINDDYFEDLTPENFNTLLDDLAAGRPVRVGSQTGRVTSEPAGGLTSLISLYGVDGRSGPGFIDASGHSSGDAGRAGEEKAAQDGEGAPANGQERLDQGRRESAAKPVHSGAGETQRHEQPASDARPPQPAGSSTDNQGTR